MLDYPHIMQAKIFQSLLEISPGKTGEKNYKNISVY